MSEGVLFINPEGLFLAINAKAETVLRKEGKELLLQSFWKFFPDDSFGFSMREALHQETFAQTPFSVFWKDRQITVTPRKYLGEDPLPGILLLLQDVTRQNRQEDLLRQKSRLEEIGMMSALVAHEIKNPLGGIRGYGMLLQKNLDDPSLEKMAASIVDGTNRLDALLTKILQCLKPNQLSLEKTNLTGLIQSAVSFVRQDALLGKSIFWNLHLPTQPIYAWVDPSLIERALLNVLINAQQAIEDQGEISINLWQQDQSCIITVSDTGCGLCPKTEEKIFSPFFTTKKTGHGLGLTETKKIVQEHNGSLEARSNVVQGTVFSMKLPLRKAL